VGSTYILEVTRKPKLMDMFALGIMPNIELHGVVKLVRLWKSVHICSIMARFTQIEVCTFFTMPPLIFNEHGTPFAQMLTWFPHWVALVGTILLCNNNFDSICCSYLQICPLLWQHANTVVYMPSTYKCHGC
jgi:hypothetical protein